MLKTKKAKNHVLGSVTHPKDVDLLLLASVEIQYHTDL